VQSRNLLTLPICLWLELSQVGVSPLHDSRRATASDTHEHRREDHDLQQTDGDQHE
jgi:hypothetical protein